MRVTNLDETFYASSEERDPETRGYGAMQPSRLCIPSRVEFGSGSINWSKHTWSPTCGDFMDATLSIPHIEWAGATVSIRLKNVLQKELEISINAITFWSDSMTVLCYNWNKSKRLHTYVANCVAFIREDSSPSRWRYIESNSNPADDASQEQLQSPSSRMTTR